MTRFIAPFALVFGLASSEPVQAIPGQYSGCGGRIVDASTRQDIAFPDLASKIEGADIVLFGERHGVRDQAVAASCILSVLSDSGRKSTVIMEMLHSSDNAAIETYRLGHPESPAGLGVELKWWVRGWPAFDNWLPLIERAFALRSTLAGGDLPIDDDKPRKLKASEKAAISQALRRSAKSVQANWQEAMSQAHCGLLDADEAVRLGEHQIRRDLSIAGAAAKARGDDGAVLAQVGRGHSRKDRSLYIAASQNAKVVSVGAFAVQEPIAESDWKAYDFIWVTGSANISDPCAFTGGKGEAKQ